MSESSPGTATPLPPDDGDIIVLGRDVGGGDGGNAFDPLFDAADVLIKPDVVEDAVEGIV